MKTIEERIGQQLDAISGASQIWDDSTLETVRQAPEGVTAYDLLLAELNQIEPEAEEKSQL